MRMAPSNLIHSYANTWTITTGTAPLLASVAVGYICMSSYMYMSELSEHHHVHHVLLLCACSRWVYIPLIQVNGPSAAELLLLALRQFPASTSKRYNFCKCRTLNERAMLYDSPWKEFVAHLLSPFWTWFHSVRRRLTSLDTVSPLEICSEDFRY